MIHLILYAEVALFIARIFQPSLKIDSGAANMGVGIVGVLMDHIEALVLAMKTIEKSLSDILKG